MTITIDDFPFNARFEDEGSPETCASFRKEMPFSSHVVHVRWSGEGMWIPLADKDFQVAYEDATSYPSPARSSCIPREEARRKY
jgi:hypothetical protein